MSAATSAATSALMATAAVSANTQSLMFAANNGIGQTAVNLIATVLGIGVVLSIIIILWHIMTR